MPLPRWPHRPDRDAAELRHLILRDHLAAERTYLANERTFLAYVRTALALIAGGVTLLHFFATLSARLAGFTLLALGSLAFLLGLLRFVRVQRRIGSYYRLNRANAAEATGADPDAVDPP